MSPAEVADRRAALARAVREAEGGEVHVFGCAQDGLDLTLPGAQWCDRRRAADAPVIFHADVRFYASLWSRDWICLTCGETDARGDA